MQSLQEQLWRQLGSVLSEVTPLHTTVFTPLSTSRTDLVSSVTDLTKSYPTAIDPLPCFLEACILSATTTQTKEAHRSSTCSSSRCSRSPIRTQWSLVFVFLILVTSHRSACTNESQSVCFLPSDHLLYLLVCSS